MTLPSKELLSDILDIEVIDIKSIQDYIHYFTDSSIRSIPISIYELIHKMKVWADNRGYIIYSSVNGFCYFDEKEYIADSEFEVISLCCEIILEQQK